MKSAHGGRIAAALVALAALHATPALAQRVFVAAQGSDANPCSFAAPCRTFQHAHDVVAAHGEIDVLDPAGYGMLTITKAISIQGHGFSGVSVGSGGTGITIAAGPNDTISLNGLIIEGGGVGNTGIQFNAGKSLVVENCVVRNMTLVGLHLVSSSTALQTLSVSNSYFTETGDGIAIHTLSSGAVTATVDRVGFYGNSISGLRAIGSLGTGPLTVVATDSVADDGGTQAGGFAVLSAAGQSPTVMLLTRVMSSGNFVGINAFGTNATIKLAHSTVSGNGEGYSAANGAAIVSYGDNTFAGNGPNNGVLVIASRQ